MKGAVESIIAEQKNGRFKSIFDYLTRVDAKASNKKTLENLALSGALDAFGFIRSAFLHLMEKAKPILKHSSNFLQVFAMVKTPIRFPCLVMKRNR